VTFSLFLVGAVPALRCGVVIVAQMLGGIAAAAVVSGILPGDLTVNNRLGDETSITRGLFIEMFGTCELTFAVIMLAALKHKATYLAPMGIGMALFVGHLFCESSSSDLTSIRDLADRSIGRHILYRRGAKPRSIIRARCDQRQFSWLPLDLLARTSTGSCLVGGHVASARAASMGNLQSRPGL
jgi:hypothetical protein